MKSKSFPLSKRAVFNACLAALKELHCDVESEDYHGGVIKASKQGGLLSYGHRINITVKTTDSEKTRIRVTSECTGIQVVDWGTNSENEVQIVETIASALV